LIQLARKEKVHVVVVGLNVNSKTADTLVREIDGIKIQLDTLGNPEEENKSTYVKLMRFNAYQLFHALNKMPE
jgi:ABC-type Zn uptake system ZnuABC Zn-binding protein ZnuA